MGILKNKVMKVYQTLVLLVLVAAATASLAKRRRLGGKLSPEDGKLSAEEQKEDKFWGFNGKYFIRDAERCKADLEEWKNDKECGPGKEYDTEHECCDWWEQIAGDDGCRQNIPWNTEHKLCTDEGYQNDLKQNTQKEYCDRETSNYNF